MSKGNLLLRNDTFFGVCEGLGQDFGFHPNWLRIAFAAGFYFNPTVVIGTYLVLGVLVAVSRLAFPDRRSTATATGEPHLAASSEATEKEQFQLAA
jgi:phage shock protein C